MLQDILEDYHIQWHPPLDRHYTNFEPFTELHLRERPFDFYAGGGGRKTLQKKIPALILGEKILRLALGGAFALRNLFSHSKFRLSQSEICFGSPKSAFRTL